MRSKGLTGWSIAICAMACVLVVQGTAHAASPVVLDGQFQDWAGKAHLEDPAYDTKHHWDDVRYWYWATNDDDPSMYFMVQRFAKHWAAGEGVEGQDEGPPEEEPAQSPDDTLVSPDKAKEKKEVYYTAFIDTGNDGRFDDPGDVVVFADYYPELLGLVVVTVFRDSDVYVHAGLWGDTETSGGLRCEWSVPFSEIGIQPGQAIRLVLFAKDKRKEVWPDPISAYEALVQKREADRVPDTGDLQWAPVASLGQGGWLLLVACGVAIPAIIRCRSRRLS